MVTRPSLRPSLRTERGLASPECRWVGGIDEVGRGALAGPVAAGVVVVDAHEQRSLKGVADSKLLVHRARVDMVPRIQRWSVAHAVGMASAAEIDDVGLSAALRLAGLRALEQIAAAGVAVDLVLMDGNYNWLRDPEELAPAPCPPVVTRIKADLKCTSVAAASVLAKVARDELMTGLAQQHPDFGWEINKGYATAAHRAAIDRVGPCVQHRRTWRLGTTVLEEQEAACGRMEP